MRYVLIALMLAVVVPPANAAPGYKDPPDFTVFGGTDSLGLYKRVKMLDVEPEKFIRNREEVLFVFPFTDTLFKTSGYLTWLIGSYRWSGPEYQHVDFKVSVLIGEQWIESVGYVVNAPGVSFSDGHPSFHKGSMIPRSSDGVVIPAGMNPKQPGKRRVDLMFAFPSRLPDGQDFRVKKIKAAKLEIIRRPELKLHR